MRFAFLKDHSGYCSKNMADAGSAETRLDTKGLM